MLFHMQSRTLPACAKHLGMGIMGQIEIQTGRSNYDSNNVYIFVRNNQLIYIMTGDLNVIMTINIKYFNI